MSDAWLHQVRIDLDEQRARLAREEPDAPPLAPLRAVLEANGAALVCQHDAFAAYVAEAEREGTDGYPLYSWTKATIEDPAKKAKYLKSFTLYVGDAQVYPKALADTLAEALEPLVGQGMILRIHRFDSNPASNPQPPSAAA